MKDVASQYLDALLKEPLNTGNSLATFERILATNFIFSSIVTTNSNDEVINNNEGGKAHFINEIKKMHFENVRAIVSRKPEEYSLGEGLNQIICKVESVQLRWGNGLNEVNGAGNYKLTATVVMTFISENHEVKILKLEQTAYNKEFIPNAPNLSKAKFIISEGFAVR